MPPVRRSPPTDLHLLESSLEAVELWPGGRGWVHGCTENERAAKKMIRAGFLARFGGNLDGKMGGGYLYRVTFGAPSDASNTLSQVQLYEYA